MVLNGARVMRRPRKEAFVNRILEGVVCVVSENSRVMIESFEERVGVFWMVSFEEEDKELRVFGGICLRYIYSVDDQGVVTPDCQLLMRAS